MRLVSVLLVCALLPLAPLACARPRGETPADRRQYVEEMSQRTLDEFYASNPKLRASVEAAAGYAIFTNVGVHVLMLSTGNGYGMAVDQRAGQRTYMRMARIGTGVGAGVKSMRVLFVFHRPAELKRFVEVGLEVSGEAGASAKAGDVGAGMGARGTASGSGAAIGAEDDLIAPANESEGIGVDVYQLTDTGVALEATIGGTKYWKDGSLN